MIIENLKREEIEKRVSQGVSLVYFYSKTCGPCVITQKIIEEISALENITIYKVESEKEKKWSKELAVDVIPMTFLVKDGQVLNKIVGLTKKSDFFDLVRKFA